jgi:hypothetical protein
MRNRKDTYVTFRCDADLKKAFTEKAQVGENDTVASVMRELMRNYLMTSPTKEKTRA